jgi:hypothetical protein
MAMVRHTNIPISAVEVKSLNIRLPNPAIKMRLVMMMAFPVRAVVR